MEYRPIPMLHCIMPAGIKVLFCGTNHASLGLTACALVCLPFVCVILNAEQCGLVG